MDTEARTLRLEGRTIAYDELVLATGATHSYFGHPEWERFAPGLKTLEDARAIRTDVLMAFERAEMRDDPAERERLMTIAVIGGGPTGVEMAGAVAELARLALVKDFRRINPAEARVVLLEAAPRILLTFPEDLAAYAEKALRRLGVTIRTSSPVEDISEEGVTAEGRVFARRGEDLGRRGRGVTGRPLARDRNRPGGPGAGEPGSQRAGARACPCAGRRVASRLARTAIPCPASRRWRTSRAAIWQGPAGAACGREAARPVPLSQPGQSRGGGPKFRRDPVRPPAFARLSRLGAVGHRPRLPAGGFPEPVSGGDAVAVGLSHLVARRAHHRRGAEALTPFPSPLWGGIKGGGRKVEAAPDAGECEAAIATAHLRPLTGRPTPTPTPPRKGEGRGDGLQTACPAHQPDDHAHWKL